MSEFRPFRGIKVADFSQGIAGPYCAQLLALYGAEVVKIEPLEGDWARPLGKEQREMSAFFISVNRGKRSVAIDLKSEASREIVRRLVDGVDVVVENFRPGIADRLGFGYDAVRAANPDAIYVSITGYGQFGPYNARPATDTVVQAFSGMADFNRGVDGKPHKLRIIPIDTTTGMYAFQNVCAALYDRERGGGGRRFDISLMQSAAALQAPRILEYHIDEGDPPAEQYMPVGMYQTRDQLIGLSTVRQSQFEELCNVLECPELVDDPRFRNNWDRMRNAEALNALLEERFGTRDAAEWSGVLEANGIMNAVVQTYREVLDDPQMVETGTIIWLDQEGIGRVPVINVPGTDESALESRTAPALGVHTDEVLAQLGLSSADIRELREHEIILPAGNVTETSV